MKSYGRFGTFSAVRAKFLRRITYLYQFRADNCTLMEILPFLTPPIPD